MKIDKIIIQNIKSFKDIVEIDFNKDFNILIGPNGSGKSNLLDIITICIRHFFLKPCTISENRDNLGLYQEITISPIYGNITQQLEKYNGDNSISALRIDFIVTEEDIKNIEEISNRVPEINIELSKFRNYQGYSNQLIEIKRWNTDLIKANDVISYNIIDYKVNNINESPKHKFFYQYLNFFEFIKILGKEIPAFKLNTNYLFFTPYRGVNMSNLGAILSGGNFYQSLHQSIANSTTKTTFTLINSATMHFAEKRRELEENAANEGYISKWENDEEVKLVTKYLEKLGYSWDLRLTNKNKNEYQILFKKDGEEFYINQASSGEKEIIDFLLVIFAFNIHNGIIIIDEPELHLHPRWQNVIMELFLELSKSTKNQFILSTHSPTFINDKSYSHIFRIYKNEYNVSEEITFKDHDSFKLRDILHIINSTNNEKLFFSDVVILVEGISDRLVFQRILLEQLSSRNSTKTVEIIEIKGKSNIDNFKKFLAALKIPAYFISDLDYVIDIGSEEVKKLFVTDQKKIAKDVIKNPKSKDGKTLINAIDKSIKEKNTIYIEDIWPYIKSQRKKLKLSLNKQEEEVLQKFITKQQNNNNYILSKGDIEDYFPVGFKAKNLANVLNLLKEENYKNWKKTSEFNDLCNIIDDVLVKSKIEDN